MATEYGVTEVAEAIDNAISSHRAESTISSYMRHLQLFLNWWNNSTLKGIPIPKARNLYLAHCSAQNRFKSMLAATAAFNFFLGKQQGPDKDVERSLLESASRLQAPTRHRVKMTTQDYSAIISVGYNASEEPLVAIAALAVILFRGFLRISEARSLTKADVFIDGHTISLLVRRSKTDQTSQGTRVKFCLESSYMEFALFTKHLSIVQNTDNVFLFPSHSTKLPLTLSTITDRLTNLFHMAGLGSKGYTTHSFRGGAASAALEQGIDGNRIMAMGRWKSAKGFQSYIEPTPIPISVPFSQTGSAHNCNEV
ncbi:site-specific recombinase, phage integrase family [Oesophagostomum dentatum]|uniref:Site-specific recombinase, phage integrase family n=1 Tax=Oesophagostomum dentatum TaxID=61180 RepID=A0A0B1TSY3_OESDE|nr:site-specific recombinase, phage integrase family [Oesophagostomum dentatum]